MKKMVLALVTVLSVLVLTGCAHKDTTATEMSAQKAAHTDYKGESSMK